ncbi:MAG: hemerythrin domain-containing protein [Maribacter sp.]
MSAEVNKPMKRHRAMQPLSRDHHHGLLLCWKIRTGLAKGIETQRIKRYIDWFFTNHALPHFELEERYLFPILGTENELVKKALLEHGRLTLLFRDTDGITKSLASIQDELEKHIRFEERILFNEIEKSATVKQLQTILKMHNDEKFNDNTDDPFWDQKD